MSILEKIDDQLTTQVLANIGKATVQAFGTASDLAKVGAEHTVRYVQIDAVIWCGVPLSFAVIFALFACVIGRKVHWGGDETIGQIFTIMLSGACAVCLFIGAITTCNYLPTAIEPAGSIIHEALAKHQ